MAIVLVEVTAVLTRTVFVKPPDWYRENTSMPRAIVNATVTSTSVDAKPVNDQEELAVLIPLDPNFAYRLADFNVWLQQDVANDWNAIAYLEIFNGVRNLPANTVMRHPVAIDDGLRINAPVEMWMGRFEHGAKPNYVIQTGPAGGAAIITFEATNQAAAVGAAGSMGMMATFFEFEIEQAEHLGMHWPALAYNR